MMQNRRGSSPDGKMFGIIFMILGVIGTVIAWILVEVNGSLPRIFLAGPPLITLGLAMIILPGDPQLSATDPRWIRQSPLLHKAVWLVAAGIGIFISFRFLLGWS
jgi:hypothetical protein